MYLCANTRIISMIAIILGGSENRAKNQRSAMKFMAQGVRHMIVLVSGLSCLML